MTNKEFKKVLTECGIDFEIYGYEGILNLVSMGEQLISEEDKTHGRTSIAKLEKEISDNIFNALQERGYYN